MNDLTQLFKDVGTPLGVLIALLYGTHRAAKFLAPWVEKLFASHLGMVDALKSNAEHSQPIIKDTHVMVGDIHDAVVPK